MRSLPSASSRKWMLLGNEQESVENFFRMSLTASLSSSHVFLLLKLIISMTWWRRADVQRCLRNFSGRIFVTWFMKQ